MIEREGCKLRFSDGSMSIFQLKRKGLKASRGAFTKENLDVTFKVMGIHAKIYSIGFFFSL